MTQKISTGRIKLLAMTVVVLAALVACYFPLRKLLLADEGFLELTQAPVWADLQVIEYRHRSVAGLKMPVILRGSNGADGSDVMGVYGEKRGRPYVWIVLDQNAGDNGIYSMPNDVEFHLSCRYLSDISSKERIDGIVFNELVEHCAD